MKKEFKNLNVGGKHIEIMSQCQFWNKYDFRNLHCARNTHCARKIILLKLKIRTLCKESTLCKTFCQKNKTTLYQGLHCAKPPCARTYCTSNMSNIVLLQTAVLFSLLVINVAACNANSLFPISKIQSFFCYICSRTLFLPPQICTMRELSVIYNISAKSEA